MNVIRYGLPAGLAMLIISSLGTRDVLAQRLELFSEDFESVTLEDTIDESSAAEEVWTNIPPSGWTLENDLPGLDDEDIGVFEWQGWAFVDAEWWFFVDNQRRVEFESGDGVIAVADPDEWDDRGSPVSLGLYNTFLTTPAISLAGVQPNSVELVFDSSWRPEAFDDFDGSNNQTAVLTAIFDGARQEVLRWDSDPDSEFYKPDDDPEESTNERVVLSLNNPAGASEMMLTFSVEEAGNDWWWALDNIELTGEAGGGGLADLNGDGVVTEEDANLFGSQIGAPQVNPLFDVNGDGQVDGVDLTAWAKDLANTWIGDADLSGEFNTGDFVKVFQAGKFETGADANWGEGDWNGDGLFDSGDFVAAFQDGGFENGPRPAQAVPEPSAGIMLAIGLSLLTILRREPR